MSLQPSLENIAWCAAQKKKQEERIKEAEELKKQFHPVPELLGYTTSEQLAEWVAGCEARWKTIPNYPWETQKYMYTEKARHEPIVEKCKRYLQEHPVDPSKVQPSPTPVNRPDVHSYAVRPLNPGSAQPALTHTRPTSQVVQWVQGNRIIMRPEDREVLPGERMSRVRIG